ncbi:GntR family transcriptional regulator [Microtetraspora sp. NBRC 13810]|uniref:GntR family transcriptional regulator n=1 Tax=Microtetraspora sp. NBRC 13810 TaxID=3030990 RepID=UPI0024A37CF4|nr:GntR family transcriptional regulator [Microtetraspora sp. NBRC 13810]GLW07133.1 GntR family transcriptional regulator [Microtetraspora sp. NBRC 13810]
MTSEMERRLKGQVPPARRTVLTEDVYEHLKTLIMDGELAPGARVNIYAVARLLDVSQTPVREVLARLESDGLVTKEPLRGYSVAPVLTPAQVTDLYDLRLLLEPWAAGRAAAAVTAAGAQRLRAELESLAGAPEGTSYQQYRAIQGHDARFHDLIAELSGSEAVRDALERTHSHLHLFRLDYPGRDSGEPTLDEHHAIGEAVIAGRPEEAETAMRDHLSRARNRFLSA